MTSVDADSEECPLCASADVAEWESDDVRSYSKCIRCDLVFVPPQFHLSREAEKARYELHENSLSDTGYTKFLGRIIKPLKEQFAKGSKVLDFGSGPNPVMATLLRAEGFEVEIYDSMYAADDRVFEQTYDFITLTEVLEHLSRPRFELAKLQSILRPGGVIAVMMSLLDDSVEFSEWHYKNDPTHVCFCSWQTCLWLAGQFGLKPERIENDIVLFEKIAVENAASV